MFVFGSTLPTPFDTGRIFVDAIDSVTQTITIRQEGTDGPASVSLLGGDSLRFVASAPVSLEVDDVLRFVTPGDGSLENPFFAVDEAVQAMANNGTGIIRIVGNDEMGLPTANTVSGRPLLRPGAARAVINDYHYYIGTDAQGNPLSDGKEFNVPAGVTVMVDAGATFRMSKSNVDVGSSSQLESRAGASLQLLGIPGKPVEFSSTMAEAVQRSRNPSPSDSNVDAINMPVGTYTTADASKWGGIVLREDSDAGVPGVFLNSLQYTTLSYGGGQVIVDSQPDFFSPIQIESTRPSLSNNVITVNANAGIAATPNAFLEDSERMGVVLSGNTILANTIDGLLIDIRTEFGASLETLDVPARFTSTEVAYVLQENLLITGGAGGYLENASGEAQVRPSGRLKIDPGVLVKLQNSRIELGRGPAQLIAEGHETKPITFTSLNDHRYGAGGGFNTNGNQADLKDTYDFTAVNPLAAQTTNTETEAKHIANAGEWGGIILNSGSSASIDHSYIAFAGGTTPIEGAFDKFNPIEVHEASLRLANSRLEFNDSGDASTDRNARGSNIGATVFVRSAEPILVRNDFRNNAGATDFNQCEFHDGN